ncbi:cobalamin biosynthesis protein [Lachnospiraceae bacterium 46-15]
MKVSMISFSWTGCRLAERICSTLKERSYEVKSYRKSKYAEKMLDESGDKGEARILENMKESSEPITESVREWAGKRFVDSDAIVFVGACGIAVRSIAPFVKSKKMDPAVVVVDEKGNYAISLLSGHIGGANELTWEIADIVHAEPIVTTATDLNRKFAVDVFAKKNECVISDMKLAKEISAALLAEEEVGFDTDFPCIGEIPRGLRRCEAWDERPELGICVTLNDRKRLFSHTLYLIPRIITVGVGCKKGTSKEAVENVIRRACGEISVSPAAMAQVASIDLKKEEEGILEYCKERNLPFLVYTAEELKRTEGTFTASGFVKEVTGVDNVCERAAVLGTGIDGKTGRLIGRKYAQDGVTAALAVKDWRVEFE